MQSNSSTGVIPKTGPGSTSFTVHAVAFLSGLATMALGMLTHLTAGGPGTNSVTVAVGGLVALGSTIAKLIHDKGIHVATICAIGHDVVNSLPDIEAVGQSLDPTITAKVEAEVAKVRGDLEVKLASVPDAAAIEGIVKTALAGILQQGAAATPATPA